MLYVYNLVCDHMYSGVPSRFWSNSYLMYFFVMSNASTICIIEWMLQKYAKECPNIVRLYGNSLEHKVFPTLGKHFSKRASAREYRPDPELKDISVHNLMRLEDKPLSEEIRRFDELFRKYEAGEYEPTLGDLKKYRRLTSEASQMEVKQHHVIFCTTAVAASPRLIKACSGNIQQLIIDEAGMCTEPESLAAIISTKAKQVVLIGDHMQLQPVLKSKYAAELGLEKSLFERYSDRANMLRIQYRMVRIFQVMPNKLFRNKPFFLNWETCTKVLHVLSSIQEYASFHQINFTKVNFGQSLLRSGTSRTL